MSNAWEQRLQQANAKASTQSGGSSAWGERLRQAEAASASQMEMAANQAAAQAEAQKAETIRQIASAYPLSPENLGPSPLQTNRASNSPYSAILNGLSPMQSNVQPVSRAVDEPLERLKINQHDPIFEEQAQKKQAEQAAKDRIASRNTSDFMEGVRTGMKEQPKEQAQPTQSRNLLAVNVDAERSKRENAEKMQNQIKDLQKVVNAYDATGIYDDRYAAYKFTLDEAQKEYDRLYSGVMKDQDIDQAEKLQRLAEIESVQGNSDYWGKTQYDPSLGSVSTYNPVTNTYETTGDLVYDIVNDRNGARGIDAANAAAMGADLAGLDLSRLKQMSADERRVYNYLYNTNGKEQAEEYLQLLSSDLNARQMNEVTTWWRDYAAEHPMAASAASVVMSPMRGLSYLGQAGDMAMINKDEEGYYRTGLDQNAGYNRFTRIPSEIRNEVSQNIEKSWGKEGSFLYQTGMSMADFITNAALSGNFLGNAPGSAAAAVSEALSLTIMGTGAAADATIAAKERGLDDDQSFALGTIAGVAEILTEKVSMESLLDLTHMDRNMIGYLLKNTLAEGSEEVGSDFINLFADIIVAKDESEWAKSVQEYKDRGMKDDQAFWAAFADQGKQMGMDFLGGAISGLAMASGSVTINQTAQAINNRRFENAIAQLREMDAQARSLDAQAAADAIAEAQENIQPGTDATMEQDASPANSAPEANAQADVELAQQLAANGTDPAIISAITGLMLDQEGNWTAAAETQQAVQPAEQMITQPAEQTTTQAAEPADIVNGGTVNEVPVLGSSEWNDGTRTGGQAGPVAESAGRAAENVATRARELGAVRAGRYAAATGEVRSTADLGIQNGIESKTLREVPYTADPELENIHQLTQAMGVDTVFLDHKMQIRNNGRIQNVNGAYDPSTNRIYVCVTDAKHTASALTMHEMYHAMQAANKTMTETIWNALENDNRFGTEYMNNRLLKTIEAYRGVYGTSEEDLAKYKDEVVADIYGGLNRGKLEVTPDLQNAVMEIADQPQWSTPGEARAEAEPEVTVQAEPEQEKQTNFSMSEDEGTEGNTDIRASGDEAYEEQVAEVAPQVQYSLTEEFVRRANAEGQMRLSVADETEEELPETQDQQTRAQAEAMTQAQLEQRLKTDREQTEKYNLLRTEGMITPELERRAQVHEDATRVREQVLAEKRKGTGDSIDTQVDLTIRVGRKESARNLLRNLEQRKSALSMLPKSQQDAKMMADLNAGIERLKNHLREQNKSARQEIRKQREETARNVQANESRTTLRDELLRSFSVDQGRRGQIGQLIDDFATRIQEQGRLSRDDRNRLFNELLDSGAVRVIEDDYAAEIRDQLRGTRVYVPQEVRDEWKGDFNEFQKRAWGSGLYLTSNPDDGSWDIHNAKLAELYPGAFAEDETDAKVALENMLSAAENGKPVNMSLRDWLKLESGGSEEGTASALRTMMEEMDAALNRFAGAQKIEIDMKARSIMEEAREMLAMQERADRIRENRELSELQKETMNSMRQLSRLRKKTSNATRAQIDAVIGNIDLLARHISPEGLENLQALEREYQARKEELGANFIPNDYVEERLSRLSKRHIDEMDADELRELGRVVSGMVTSIRNAQQMIGEENARMIADVANDWQDEVSNSKGMNTNLLNRWLKADQARPSTFLQMISGWRDGAGQLLARQLESGELKQLRFMQRASEMFDPFTKENKEWLKKASGKNAEWITINGIDGVDAEGNGHVTSISITPMMRVALYMHANNYDNMRHIAEGGIRIPDQKLYQQGKVDEAYNRGKLILLQPTDLYKILGGSPKTGDLGSNMTDQEKAFAKILKQYMDGLSKEAINETSMELDGFERAMEANYYPIQTDRRFRKTQPDAVSHDISVENTGSIANERVHAANPVELRDATDTLAWHMEQTARYHGMAVPIRNLNAVYNYNFMREAGAGARYAGSLKNTIDQKWGGDASKYIEQLMADLQGGQSAEQSTFGQISAQLRGKLAGATLTLNPSVALSQAASYPAALQQLGVKAMVRGLNLANRVDENLIAAYSPLLWYRAQGNITDELNKDNLKLPRVLDWISEMDRATIKRLWAASEAWVQENTDLQKPETPAMDGSDPYYQRVADKFNRVVFDTQPNYTTMQRTQLQRQGNELTKILAMYKTVPLQYYNMMLEAQSRLQETSARAKAENATDADKKAYEEARQFAARTHTGLLISNAVYVLMKTVLMNALVRKRDDLKDDEGNTTLASAAEGIAWALAEVYAGSIIGSDVLMQAAKHLAKGDRFYGLELSSVSTINDLVEQGIDIGDVLKKVLTGTADLDDGLDAIHDAAAMATRLLGIPAENVEKYMVSAMKWIAPEWANKYENLFDQIEKRDLKSGSSQKDLEAQISVLMENRTDDLQDETIQELSRLWAAGYGNVIPTAIQNTATVNGEDITLTAKQKKAYRDAWSDPVTASLQDLMDTDLYQEADDEQRQKMIASLYDYARGKAKESALDVEPDAWIKAADESDMNLADYIAERVWLNGMAGNDDQSATEVKMEQLMAADMDDVLRAQTYRNVLASPSEKAALEAVGGTEADQVEAVNTLYQIRTATATDEQTAAEQKRIAILESDLTKEQQAELYYNVLADKDGKAWIDNVTAAGDDKADVVQALMNFQNSSGTVEKIQTILDSDLSDEGKLELYHKITKERDDRIETFEKAGLDLDDYLTITQKYSEINAGDESAGEKSTAFAKWLEDQRFTRNQIDTVKDEMGYYSMVRANSDKYDALTDAGISSQNAQRIYEFVNALEPEDGASQVSEIQKLEAIGNSGLSAAQQLEAAKVYASDSSDRKLDVLDGYSVSVSQWAEFRTLYAEYQEQYKGQKGSNQNAAKDAAMDVIGSNISTQAGREAAAALWQTADTGWKAKNNPFDVSTGEAIYNSMH